MSRRHEKTPALILGARVEPVHTMVDALLHVIMFPQISAAAWNALLKPVIIRFGTDADGYSLEESRPSWVQSPMCTSKRSRIRRRLHRPAGHSRAHTHPPTHTHTLSLSHTCLH